MKSAIIVPIKTNNQRLPGKNTRPLNGKHLYKYLFETLKRCDTVNNIYIDSSDDMILDTAEHWGFKTIKRPVSLNSPETSGYDLLNFELPHIEEEIICQVFVTLPFITSKTITESIRCLQENKNVDSVLNLYPMHDRFWFKRIPVNHDPGSLVGTQYMEPIMREAGFYVFKKHAFLREQKRVTSKFIEFSVDPDECIDIDTMQDFIYAEAYAKWRKDN